jgi:hypothetical protein
MYLNAGSFQEHIIGIEQNYKPFDALHGLWSCYPVYYTTNPCSSIKPYILSWHILFYFLEYGKYFVVLTKLLSYNAQIS